MLRSAYTFLFTFLFFNISFAQDSKQLIVFNPEGLIVKSYAPENHKGIHIRYNNQGFHNFLIENVPDEDKNKYYLIYQYRINDKNHEPGIINIHEDVHIEQFKATGIDREVLTLAIGENRCHVDARRDANHKERDIVSYALIKLNIPDYMPIPHVENKILLNFNRALTEKLQEDISYSDSCLVLSLFKDMYERITKEVPMKDASFWNNLGVKKRFLEEAGYSYYRNLLKIQFLRYWMKIVGFYSTEKVLGIDFYKNSIFRIDKSLNITNNDNINNLINCKEYQIDSDTVLTKMNDTLSLNRKRLKVLEERSKQLASSKIDSILISMTNQIIDLNEEIFRLEASIKSLKKSRLENCKKKLDRLAEMSIGRKFKDCLKKFPFLENEAVDVLHIGYAIENTHETKEVIYEVDIRKVNNSDTVALTFARQTPRLPQLTTDDRLFAKVINLTPELLLSNPFFLGMKVDQNTTVKEWEIANGPKIKVVEGNGLADLVNFGFGKSEDLSPPLGSLKNESSDYGETKYFNKVYLVLKSHLIPSSEKRSTYYIDYLLRFPNTLRYSSKPEITFSVPSLNLDPEKVNPQNAYVDYFDPVRTRYSFSINTGAIFSQFTNYSYDSTLVEGTNDIFFLQERKISERKFVPAVFLSFYPWANDIFDGKLNKTKLHLDVGVDINGSDILNNVYVGAGLEVHRYIQIVGGYRFGSHQRADLSRIAPNSLDISNLLKNETDGSFYFGILLGYNIF
ncbi:MAG: hypothetical protein AAGA77_00915 [Bacteroidota bacterium]